MGTNHYYDLAGVEFIKPHDPSFVGKGPKNYNPNKRLWEEVCLNLTFHPQIDASNIEVILSDEVAILRGWVPTRKMKRLASRCVSQVEGIKKVINEINIPPFYMDIRHDEFDTF
jgi:osmotically-inducible protein OsmY